MQLKPHRAWPVQSVTDADGKGYCLWCKKYADVRECENCGKYFCKECLTKCARCHRRFCVYCYGTETDGCIECH